MSTGYFKRRHPLRSGICLRAFEHAPEYANVGELTSPFDGIKRVYGVAHVRDTGLVAMIGIPSSTLYEPARRGCCVMPLWG